MATTRPLSSPQQAEADQATAAVNARVDAMGAVPNIPLPEVSTEQLDLARQKREENTSTGDYIGAMFSQDSLVTGAMASLAEHNSFVPDDKHNPFDPVKRKELTKGIWPEFHNEFNNTTSDAQAGFIKSRIEDKQRELTQLGDLGIPGNIGRIALGIVSPDNLALGVVGGWLARGVRAAQTMEAMNAVRRAATAETRLAALEKLSLKVAEIEGGKAGGKAALTGIAGATAGNVGIEKLRQMANFEDDNGLLLDSAIMGLPLVVPLSILGSRHAGRAAVKARAEADALNALRKIQLGDEAFAKKLKDSENTIIGDAWTQQVGQSHSLGNELHEAVRAIRDAHQYGHHLADFYAGKIDADEVITLDHNYMVRQGLVPADETIEVGGTANKSRVSNDSEWQPGVEGIHVVEGEFIDAGTGKPVERPLKVRDMFVQELTDEDWAAMTRKAEKPPEVPPVETVPEKSALDSLDHTRIDSTPDDIAGMKTLNGNLSRWFNQKGGDADFDPVTSAGLNETARQSASLASAIAAIFGKKVVFFKQKKMTFGGMFDPATPDRVYVNLDGAPHVWVTGHEFLHNLRAVRPDLYDDMKIAMVKVLQNRTEHHAELNAVYARAGHKYRIKADKGNEELIADVWGNAWNSRELWEILAKKDPTRFQRIASAFVEYLDRVLAKFGVNAASFSHNMKYVKDIAKAREIVAETMLKFDPRQVPGGMAHPEAPAPSLVSSLKDVHMNPHEDIAGAEHLSAFNSPWARWDYYAILNRSETPEIRTLAKQMIKDAIQNSDTVAQRRTMTESVYLYKKQIAGKFHHEAHDAYLAAVSKRGLLPMKRGEFERDFYSAVTRLTRGDPDVATEFADVLPEITRAAKAQQEVYKRMLQEAKDAGVKGAAGVAERDTYTNRIWPIQQLLAAEKLHGRAAVEQLIAEAIRIPGLAPADKPRKAANFLSTLKDLAYSPTLQNIYLHAEDMGTLRRLLENEGLGPTAIDDLVDIMFEAKALKEGDAGRVQNLKYRFDIDETHSVQSAAGTLKVSDLLENDSRLLVDLYTANMGGHAAVAKHGYASSADFQDAIKAAQKAAKDAGHDPDATKRNVAYLNDLYKSITGAPMSTQDFSATARIAHGVRAGTRSVVLNQLGISAAFEATHAMALLGARAWWQHSSIMRNLWQTFRHGYIADGQLSDDMAAMIGAGHDMNMAYARQSEVAEGWYDKAFNGFEGGGNRLSHTMDIASGNAGLTSVTRQVAAKMAAQRALRQATEGISAAERKRMVGWGVDDAMIPTVLADLRRHSEADSGGKLTSIRWEDWQQANRDSYEAFTLYLDRARRDAIQDHDVGEMMPFMHQTLGKLFGELRTFFFVAHAKNFLKNAYYHDAQSLQVWMFGFIGQQLAYMMQTAANYGHDPAELEKRMTYDRIWRAGFSRMSAAGFLPFGVETLHSAITGEQFFKPGSTANTDSRNLLKPPSVALLSGAVNAVPEVAGSIFGKNTLTKREGKDFLQSFPGSRLLGLRNAVDALTSTLPATQPKPAP